MEKKTLNGSVQICLQKIVKGMIEKACQKEKMYRSDSPRWLHLREQKRKACNVYVFVSMRGKRERILSEDDLNAILCGDE